MEAAPTAQTLWDAAADIIAATEKHPFLVAMLEGTLPMENFKYYVVQDALYLGDFAASLRLLSKNAGVSKEESRRLQEFAKGAEDAEMALHNSFFKEWDISTDGVEQMPNCLLYTSYMLRIVATRPHAEGLAVLLPCFWVYMHVGQAMLKLRQELGDSVKRPSVFDAWIDMYGGDDFAKEVHDYIVMVNTVGADPSSDIQKMKDHFIMSCKLEHMFWDQAAVLMDWPELKRID